MVDYEFEERLESFYNNEPIENQDLYDLYEGEFPEGERNPKELRIHWKDARELALAELELQMSIQTSWQDAEISERPILVLDKDGGDFYRYYEYRVLKDPKFVGAIRIPAYRRTENFATAEVHVYSADEKTYTVHPTGWGNHIINTSFISDNSLFFQEIQQIITPFFTDNIVYNWMFRMYDDLDVKDSPLADGVRSYTLLKNYYVSKDSCIPKLKKTLSKSRKDRISENMTQYKLLEFHDIMNSLNSLVFMTELIGSDMESFHEVAISAHLISYSNFYQAANHYTLDSMVAKKDKKSSLQNILKNIIWQIMEKEKSLDKLIEYQWDFGSLFSINSVTPIVQYNNFHLYPQRNPNNTKYELTLSQYTLLTMDDHNKFFKISGGLYNRQSNINIDLYNNINIDNNTVVEGIPAIVLEDALFLKNHSRFLPLLFPIRNMLLEHIKRQILLIYIKVSSLVGPLNINNINDVYKMFEDIINKIPSDDPNKQKYQNFLKLLELIRDKPKDIADYILRRLFGSWSVWVIPIFPFPTWVHYTDKHGPIPTWMMILGWPNFWTIREFPIEIPNLPIPPNPPEPPIYPSGPDALENKYNYEWYQVTEWLLDIGATELIGGHYEHGYEAVYRIIRSMENITISIYIGKTVFDPETGKPIIDPEKIDLDKGLEDVLNNDGRKLIQYHIPILTNIHKFEYGHANLP